MTKTNVKPFISQPCPAILNRSLIELPPRFGECFSPMGNQNEFWTRCRACFRICRICAWLLILALVCAVLWLNQIGLPDFAKQPIIDALRQRGIVLQFVRLRVNFVHGLVADNVRVGGETPGGPTLSLQELQLQINYAALLHRKLQLDGVVLRQGKLTLPFSATNDPSSVLTIDHIQTDLRFQTNDVWSLDNFQAGFAGAKFLLSGQMLHAGAAADWPIFHRKKAGHGATQAELRKIGSTLSQIHFNKTSQLSLNVNGDARDFDSFFAHLDINAPGVQTPWGSATNVVLVAHTVVSPQNPGVADAWVPEVDWKARVAHLRSRQFSGDFIFCDGFWRAPELEITNVFAHLAIGLPGAQAWGGARNVELVTHSVLSAPNPDFFGAWLSEMDWKAHLDDLKSDKLNADFIFCDGFWRAPELDITNLFARLGGGYLRAGARLNLRTRELSFTNSSCFDLQAITSILTKKTRERLNQFSFTEPPALAGSGSLILPEWTNRAPDWRAEVQPTIRLSGEMSVTNAAYGGFSLNETRALFVYSNEIWTLPEADMTHDDSRLEIKGNENDATRDYQWRLHGALSPGLVQPFLTPKAAREFGRFAFARPLYLDAQIRGRLYDYDSISATGHAALANFSIRGESVDIVETDFHYANRVAEFFQPHLLAGSQHMQADGIRLDIPGDRIYFTNGIGTADPQMVVHAIGPLQEQVMKPYHFLQPVTARVNGYAPLRDPTNADLDFKIIGVAQLQCLKLQTPAISGEVHWIGQTLILTNLSASLYGGNGEGNALFDFRPRYGADFSFAADFQNVNLHSVALDLSSPSNHIEHLEGAFSGHFVVTSGDSENWRSCNGYGHVDLRDGLLWDFPIFGVLSPILNIISPGMGNSRATDASAQFFMTNGVISTDNLQIQTLLMRLGCNGTVDLQGRLHAHFTAALLRDLPGIGPLFSVVTWPVGKVFECKVTGTWQNPKPKLVYLPIPTKLLLYIFHPLHTLEDWLPKDNQTNPPKQ